MATKRWIGAAQAAAQVQTVLVASYDTATTYKLTINNKIVSVVGQGGSEISTATALVAALSAGTAPPEFQEIVWSNAGGTSATITATAKTPGKPFFAAKSTSGGSGTMGTLVTVTACTGPNFWDNTANWDSGSLPVTGDDVYLENSSIDILYNLDAHTVTLASLNVAASFIGSIGLPLYSGNGSQQYYEYRGNYLQISASVIQIGYGPGPGSGRLRLNTGSAATSITVLATGHASEPNLESFCWKGTNSANKLHVMKGSVGVGAVAGESANLGGGLLVAYVGSVVADATVRVGAHVAVGSLTVTGGTTTIFTTHGTTNLGPFDVQGGTATFYGNEDMHDGNLVHNGGTVIWNSTGYVNGTTIKDQGTVDFSQELTPKTGLLPSSATVITCYPGYTWNDPFGVVSNLKLSFYLSTPNDGALQLSDAITTSILL